MPIHWPTVTLTRVPIPVWCIRTCRPLRITSNFSCRAYASTLKMEAAVLSEQRHLSARPQRVTFQPFPVLFQRHVAAKWPAYRGPWISHRAGGITAVYIDTFHLDVPRWADRERHRTAICSLPSDTIIKRIPTVVMVIVTLLMRTVCAWHNRADLLDWIQVATLSNLELYRVLL